MKVRMREHIYYTGQYAEVEVFPTIKKTSGSRKAKFQPTSECQKVINQAHALKKLRRLIHDNFTGDDYMLHLTFNDSNLPETEQDAERELKNYFRRIRRIYKKANVELKYVYFPEEASRRHFHVYIKGGIARDVIEKCWGKGYANADRLQFSEFGVADLTQYCQKQHLNYKRWQGSRNLTHPKEQEHFISSKVAKEYSESWNVQAFIEERFPDYYLVLDESVSIVNAINGFEYTSLFLCRKDAELSFYSTSFAEKEDRLNTLNPQQTESEKWIQMQLC